MTILKHLFLSFLILIAVSASPPVNASPDIQGEWYGTWESNLLTGYTSNFSMTFLGPSHDLWADMYVPELGMFNQYLPVSVVATPDGKVVTIGIPGLVVISGLLDGDSIVGSYDATALAFGTGTWQAQKPPIENVYPGEAPGPQCTNLPNLYCTGSAEYCSELVLFEPATGDGYVDYPITPETSENQYFSYLRRDLMQLLKYAAAKMACKTADWEYGNFAPLALSDMSEHDGATPGTSFGGLHHPAGTHDYGRDVDLGYFQLYTADNKLRPICVHFDGYSEVSHCVDEPYGLDKWRTALLIAYMSEHARLRVIGVDGKAGAPLEEALDELVSLGWIDADLRESIPLVHEEDDMGYGFYYFHHHHLHNSINELYDVVAAAELEPNTLNRNSRGKFVTAYIEPHEGIDVDYFDMDSLALILGGQHMLYAEPGRVKIGDYNDNGLPDLTVKFDRQKVLALIDTGMVEVSITGSMLGYYFFQENDMVNVLGKKGPETKSKSVFRKAAPNERPGHRDIWN